MPRRKAGLPSAPNVTMQAPAETTEGPWAQDSKTNGPSGASGHPTSPWSCQGPLPPHPAVPGRHRHAVPSLLCVVLMTVTLRHGPARHGQPAQGLDALTRTRHGRCELGQARWT